MSGRSTRKHRLARAGFALCATLPALHASAQQLVPDHVFVDGFEPVVDCSLELTCPVPPSQESCIAGRLVDAGSGTPMRAFFNPERTCDDGAVGGPCNLRLTAYDSLEFASNPGGALPLATSGTVLDGCGRFRFTTIDPPTFGSVTIVTDDAASEAENDLHAPGGTPRALGANQRIDRIEVVAVRRDTVARWSASAGSPFGAASFADVGSMLVQFAIGGAPAAGVTVRRNGSPVANDDYYFADADPAQRRQVDPLAASTGPNGAALVAPTGAPASYSGSGGETGGCTWRPATSASPPGVVTYVRIDCTP